MNPLPLLLYARRFDHLVTHTPRLTITTARTFPGVPSPPALLVKQGINVWCFRRTSSVHDAGVVEAGIALFDEVDSDGEDEMCNKTTGGKTVAPPRLEKEIRRTSL